MADTIEIFISCAEEDEESRKELENQLKSLKWKGLVTLWHARDVTPGTEIAPQIETHLNNARIILLLISPNFLASDYLYNSEMKRAMARHNAGKAFVIPVLLRPVHWEDPRDAQRAVNFKRSGSRRFFMACVLL